MPVWMQVVLPIFTALLGGGAGLWFGRLSKALDRRQERRAAEAAQQAEKAHWHALKRARAAKLPQFTLIERRKGYSLQNYSQYPATGITVTFTDYPREKVKGLPPEPFTLAAQERINFKLPETEDLIDMPQMWIMCDKYARPVRVTIGLVEGSVYGP